MKRIHILDRLRLRGLSGAKDEVLKAAAENLIPVLPPLPILLAPLSTWDASAERPKRDRGGARLRQASVPSRASDARLSSPQIPGPRIEAVQAWQQTARTPVAQRRFRRKERSSSRSWTREARAKRPEPDQRPADDVTAPSARHATGAGAEELPVCRDRIAVLRRPRSLLFANPRAATPRGQRRAPAGRNSGGRLTGGLANPIG